MKNKKGLLCLLIAVVIFVLSSCKGSNKSNNGYKIYYEVDGGSGVSSTSGFALPDILPYPIKEGYGFDGWYLDSDLTIEAIAGDEINCNTTLYAKWTKKLYSFINSSLLNLGRYPQNIVLPSEVNGLASIKFDSSTWIDYGYYIEGSLSSYMYYYDVDIDKDGLLDYRGVYFTSYRPAHTFDSAIEENTYQDNNGYDINTIYWFKYAPIRWNVLKIEDGKALLISRFLIDSQVYYNDNGYKIIDGNAIYANNYMYSHIRSWLNDTFYNTAFNDLEKEIIETTEVDNSLSSTNDETNIFVCENTKDKIFLLSRADTPLYYSSGREGSALGTDYANCQGLYASSYYGCDWWLRTPASNDYNNGHIFGYDYFLDPPVYDCSVGVRPVCWINL